jgi:hypothetical protein
MKVGSRTQAYFVGFLIGVAIVSILLDSRRDRFSREDAAICTWQRIQATALDLPTELVSRMDVNPYVTGVEQVDSKDQPTGLCGFFFADHEGKRFWWYGSEGSFGLYTAELLDVVSRPDLDPSLMKDGFEHQGHEVISDPDKAPDYRVRINVHSAVELVDAYENLLSKHNYIASVDWVPVEPE